MASKLNPNVLYVREPQESLTSPDLQAEAGDESSDSDGEPEETSHKLIRKVSTSGQIRAKVGFHKKKKKVLWDVVHFFFKTTPIILSTYLFIFCEKSCWSHTLIPQKTKYSIPKCAYTHTETLYSHNCSAYWSRGQSLMAQKQSILGMLWLVQCMYSINVSLY